jgi:purine-cytosine permease-like protein
MMNEPKHSTNFWLGNAILAVAMAVVLFMGSLWETMGRGAMVLWVALVVVGVYLLMKDKGQDESQ